MARILIVDDQDLVREGLVALLRAAPAGHTVSEAADGEQAVEAAARDRPDLILMDIRMPGMDGIAAMERVLAEAAPPPPRVLILTTFDHDEYLHAALRAGASGFLLKTIPARRLFAAVEAVCDGDLPFTPEITHRLIDAYTHAPPTVRDPAVGGPVIGDLASGGPAISGPPVPRSTVPALPLAAPVHVAARRTATCLTNRERDVFRLAAHGLSNADIAARLHLAEVTVKTHLYRGMNKLGLTSRAQAVAYAYQSGLITLAG
ncbi:response regulator transcription factor [Catenulispora yoronensis]|uniref:Response regulator transcription factor n=1 Tax=Catenulispora yoronensis TaxID=450799 RepID=A0ABN2ULP2_9ACTN